MEPSQFGKYLKQLLKKNNLSVIEFAAAIQTKRENVYSIFRRESFDFDLLWRMSIVLKQNLFLYFSNKLDQTHAEKLGNDLSVLEAKNAQQNSVNLDLIIAENNGLKREN